MIRSMNWHAALLFLAFAQCAFGATGLVTNVRMSRQAGAGNATINGAGRVLTLPLNAAQFPVNASAVSPRIMMAPPITRLPAGGVAEPSVADPAAALGADPISFAPAVTPPAPAENAELGTAASDDAQEAAPRAIVQLGEADPGTSQPLRDSRARANLVIYTSLGAWDPLDLQREAEQAARDAMLSFQQQRSVHLTDNAAALRQAAGGVKLRRSPLTALYARPMLLGEARRQEAEAEQARRSGADESRLLESARASVRPSERAFLEGLREYVPGLEVERVAIGRGEHLAFLPDGSVPDGYSLNQNSDGGRFIWLQRLWRGFDFHTAVHEGFHHGDQGYAVGGQALERMYGKAGQSLATVLIEGFTELRTRETLMRMAQDARAGKKGVARDLLRNYSSKAELEAQFADLEVFIALLERGGYSPFVRLVRTIIERPGGRAALEAFVYRGDVVGLYEAVGSIELEMLARVAAADEGLSDAKAPLMARAAARTGINDWLQSRLTDVMSGALRQESRVVVLERRARRLVEKIEALIESAPWWKQGLVQRALERVPVGAWLEEGRSETEIAAELERAARLLSPRDWMPAVSYANGSLVASMAAYALVPVLFPDMLLTNVPVLAAQIAGTGLLPYLFLVAAMTLAAAIYMGYIKFRANWTERVYDLISGR